MIRIAIGAWLLAASLLVSVHAPAQQATGPLLLQGARLILGNGEVIEQGALLIEDGVFSRVGERTEIPAPPGARVVDLAGKTIIPALIDAHAHLGYQGRVTWGAENYGYDNLVDNLQQYAYYGFAAVFSAGSDPAGVANRVEAARVAGHYRGARMLYAAGMAPPGQGPNNLFLEQALAVETAVGEPILWGLENPQQARQAVRDVAAAGIRFIKIWVDDRGGSQQKLSPALYRAVIAEARLLGLEVFVHQQYAADMPDLIAAGAHGFLHGRIGTDLGVAIARQAGGAGLFIVPNLGLAELRREAIAEDDFLAAILSAPQRQELGLGSGGRQLNPASDAVQDGELGASLAALLQAGADIALGTDAGAVPGHPFGYTGHRELEIYVRLGLTPMQALLAGTSVAASQLGLADLGRLAPGFSADLVVLGGNPLEDIRNTRRIEQVFLGGEELDRDALRARWSAP